MNRAELQAALEALYEAEFRARDAYEEAERLASSMTPYNYSESQFAALIDARRQADHARGRLDRTKEDVMPTLRAASEELLRGLS
jgi:hypothetical protein